MSRSVDGFQSICVTAQVPRKAPAISLTPRSNCPVLGSTEVIPCLTPACSLQLSTRGQFQHSGTVVPPALPSLPALPAEEVGERGTAGGSPAGDSPVSIGPFLEVLQQLFRTHTECKRSGFSLFSPWLKYGQCLSLC